MSNQSQKSLALSFKTNRRNTQMTTSYFCRIDKQAHHDEWLKVQCLKIVAGGAFLEEDLNRARDLYREIKSDWTKDDKVEKLPAGLNE